MITDDSSFEVLVRTLEALLNRVTNDQEVNERELVFTADQAYQHVRLHIANPPSDLETKVLELLSSAPSHPELDDLRTRAMGAVDMCSRLTSFGSIVALPMKPDDKDMLMDAHPDSREPVGMTSERTSGLDSSKHSNISEEEEVHNDVELTPSVGLREPSDEF